MKVHDVPVAKASSHGYHVQMMEVIKTLVSTTLKDNTSLQPAIMQLSVLLLSMQAAALPANWKICFKDSKCRNTGNLTGIFAGAGYMVESNKEHGEGRSDIVVTDPHNGRVAVFEAKYSKALDRMEHDCQEALAQIDDRMYAKEYEDNYDQVLCYGISFFRKRCQVRKK